MGADIRARSLDHLLKRLPHRYPFLMVDRVLEIDADRVLTLKNVSIDEPFFAGHFPDEPVMPGVLIIEALAQSGALLAMAKPDGEEQPRGLFVLTGIDKARIRRRVVPGDQLRMEVRILRFRRPMWKMQAQAHVDGILVAEAELSAIEVAGEPEPSPR